MPKNNNLEPVKLPMEIRFGVDPVTNFKILERELDIKLLNGPTEEDLLSYIPQFVNATWAEHLVINKEYTRMEAYESVIKMFTGKTLPGSLETMKFTFLIDGMTLQEVTHMLRHRLATFSAVCTGDRFMHFDDVIVPESIANSSEFYERYQKLAEASKQLYVDMIDSKEISLMDARYALPKGTRQTYYMSIAYKDLIGIMFQRIDRAIQPKGSNIIAYKLWDEVIKQIPILAALDIIDYNTPSRFFINTARTGHSTNLYIPEEHNDKFEWNEKDFIYNKQREDLIGTDEDAISSFPYILQHYINSQEELKEEYIRNNPDVAELIHKIKTAK